MTLLFIIYAGTKEIKIKFVESKKHKKFKKGQDVDQNLYIERLSKNLNKKKKH